MDNTYATQRPTYSDKQFYPLLAAALIVSAGLVAIEAFHAVLVDAVTEFVLTAHTPYGGSLVYCGVFCRCGYSLLLRALLDGSVSNVPGVWAGCRVYARFGRSERIATAARGVGGARYGGAGVGRFGAGAGGAASRPGPP